MKKKLNSSSSNTINIKPREIYSSNPVNNNKEKSFYDTHCLYCGSKNVIENRMCGTCYSKFHRISYDDYDTKNKKQNQCIYCGKKADESVCDSCRRLYSRKRSIFC